MYIYIRKVDKMKAKFGFTLAEILITLGIIGIVAAMTIPSLLGKINRTKTEAILKEDYSILQQVLKVAESKDASLDSVPDDLPGIKNWFDMYLLPYMKTVQVCYNKEGCWNSTGTTNLKNGNIPYANGKIGIGFNIITVRLLNGSTLCFDGFSKSDMKNLFGTDVDTTSFVIYIDTNGDKKPNQIGKDTFILAWRNHALVPAGSDEANEDVDKNCSNNASGNNAGYWCLKKITNNNWKIPNNIEY